MLSQVDEAKNEVHSQEKIVNDLNRRMLNGVGAKYGYNSNEYEMAGGTRQSDRKRPVRKPKTNPQ
jgi:hypothetical protein